MDKNPEIKERVVQEIHSIFGPNVEGTIVQADLSRLEYTEAVIKETMRLVPVAPFSHRELSAEDEVGGYKWRPGTVFFKNFHGIHMHKAHWQDPERFDPERFLTGTVKPNMFLPFGGGLRLCPGRHAAMLSLLTFTALVYGRYEVQMEDDKKPLKYSFSLANEIHDMRIYLRPRIH